MKYCSSYWESLRNDFMTYDIQKQQIVKALATFVTNGNNDILKWAFDIEQKYEAGLFSNKEHIASFMEAFVRNGSDEAILSNLIKIVSLDEREVLVKKFVVLIESRDANQYSTLLKTITNKEFDWPTNMLKEIRSTFLKISEEPNAQSFQILDSVVDTYYGSDYDELKYIAERSETFLTNGDQVIQNQGFALLKKINKKYNSSTEQFGIISCLSMAKEFLSNNELKGQVFLNFVLDYHDKIRWREKDDLIQLIREQIKKEKPIPVLTYILDSILRLDKESQTKFFDELLQLTESIQDNTIKEKCKQIFLSADLSSRQKRKVRNIFGEDVFGKDSMAEKNS